MGSIDPRLILTGVVALITISLGWIYNAFAQQPIQKPAQGVSYIHPSTWDVLRVGARHDNPVTSVRLIVWRYKTVMTEEEIVADIEVNDPAILRDVEWGLDSANRWADMQKRTKGYFDDLQSGELHIRTKKGEFKVGIGSTFVLDSDFDNYGKDFHSWTLAKAVDEMMWQYARRRVKLRQFELLSGEASIQYQKDQYKLRHEIKTQPN